MIAMGAVIDCMESPQSEAGFGSGRQGETIHSFGPMLGASDLTTLLAIT